MTQPPLFDSTAPKLGEIESALRKRGISTVIGVDEAGRGPLAGPVVAGAFFLDLDDRPGSMEGLDDSKKLEVADRERLYEELIGCEAPSATAHSGPEIIDDINVLQATFRAMTQAVEKVVERVGAPPDAVLVDGHLAMPHGRWDQRPIVKGDARSIAIAAASILAKVERDRYMCRVDDDWPHYGFKSHKGYPTPQHRRALKEHGPCRLHRRSFSGVSDDG